MSDKTITIRSPFGVGFLGLLCLIFIALKLSGHIDWSWWWVLAPIWAPWAIAFAAPFVLVAVVGLGALAVMAFVAVVEAIGDSNWAQVRRARKRRELVEKLRRDAR